MGTVQVGCNGYSRKGLAKLNDHKRDEYRRQVRDGVTGEGQDLSEEDEARINDGRENVNSGEDPPKDEYLPKQANLQQQQLQPSQDLPSGPEVRWDCYLPFGSLKILLVEHDDSTRQILTALLRNCNYEVTPAVNGLQAWKILVDLSNRIDLVLTEVAVPGLPGFGLLCKIMSHKTCKNIPVIMMSNHDSMGIVFKCLSKGAVDFLVKPIRKNELKNLWQHVWRRCHSSSGSGSGSESGIQTQKSVDSKSREGSDDNEQSNNEDDNGSTGLNVGDGSDHGSGTQNSWTKRAAEVDSPPALSPCDGQTDVHDSTCAQAIHPKQEKFWNNWVPDSGAEELNDQDDQPLENSAGGNNLQGADFTEPSIHPNYLPSGKVSTLQPDFGKDGAGEESTQEMKNLNEGLLEANINNTSNEPKAQDTDLIGSISCNSKLHNDIGRVNDSHGIPNLGDAHGDTLCNSKDVPFLELSLRRLRSGGNGSIDGGDNRKILRHSSASAFSRYNSAAIQAPATCMDSSSTPLEPSSVAEHRTTAVFRNQKWNQGSDGSNSNNQDMGSSTKNMFPKSSPVKENFSTPTAKYQHASETLVHGTRAQAPQEDKPSDAMTINETRRYAQVQNHHRHHSNSVQHLQSLNDPPQLHEHMECEEMVNITAAAQCCRYTYLFTGANDVQHGVNYSLNGSGSGSNHGSNTGGIKTGVANGESDTGGPGNSVNGGGSGSGSGVDQVRSAQREAALNKFRQKRKERCFEKRVRYQSRKRLAEQRPRVRGQFVRQPFQ